MKIQGEDVDPEGGGSTQRVMSKARDISDEVSRGNNLRSNVMEA